ncbi:MAG TPA: NAD-dependent epimerase/dehydratase family protein [Verrucomicrobiae bacterium]|nr:NAD-dependent epimerase/dehydratase family protein [Verrucomicrobiae bacterium]
MTKPTIAITGANGFLGSALIEHFTAKGYSVIALVRKTHTSTNPLVTYRQYDITKPISKNTLQGADFLVHTAYVKYGRRGSPDAMEVNIKGAENLLVASKQARIKKTVFISTMSAHESATSIYGRQKLAIEKLFLEEDGVVLRSGLILGHGGIVQDMAAFMKSKHVVPVIGGGKQPLQTIAIYDLAKVVETALSPKLHGLFTVATSTIYTYKSFYQALAKSLGIRVAFIPVSYHVLMAAFRSAAVLRLPLNLGEDNLRGLQQLRSADTAPDLKRLGVTIDDLETALNKINQNLSASSAKSSTRRPA